MAKSVAQKLLIKSNHILKYINAPADYLVKLGEIPDDVTIDSDVESANVVHLFVRSIAELDQFADLAISSTKDDGLLWISYPKKSSKVDTDINRDNGWEKVYGAGLRPVTQISIDDTWSALRWRENDKVGT